MMMVSERNFQPDSGRKLRKWLPGTCLPHITLKVNALPTLHNFGHMHGIQIIFWKKLQYGIGIFFKLNYSSTLLSTVPVLKNEKLNF
jgi:hypothetical protein